MATFDSIVWIFVIFVIVFLFMLVLKNTILDFETMDKSVVNATELKIPVGDTELKARIIYPKYACDDEEEDNEEEDDEEEDEEEDDEEDAE